MWRRFALTTGFLLLGSVPAWAQKQLVDRVVAVINDEAITQSELEIYLRPIYEDLKQQYQGDELMRRLNDTRLKLLNQMIEDRLVFQQAKTRGVTVDESELDEQLEQVKHRYPSSETLEKEMASQGYNLSELRENIRRQLLIRRLQDIEVRSRVVVSPREIEEYYKNHLLDFTEETRLKLLSITIRKTKEAEEKGLADEAAKKKIESIEARIRKGEAFETLARGLSEDVHASEGGEVGWVKKGELLSSIETSLYEMKAGSISPVLESPGGYHLFKIEEKNPGREIPLDEVRDKIRMTLFREKAEKRFKEWMNELKTHAYISVR